MSDDGAGESGGGGRAHRRPPVGPTDDALEREAVAVADRVMHGRAPPSLHPGLGPPGRCGSCEDDLLRRAPSDRPPAPGEAGAGPPPSPPPGDPGGAVPGRGRALGGRERAFMEPRLGQDLSGVRIHDGARAGALAQSVSARAYAVGSDVVFGAGEYRPGTRDGRRLLAHELTHVVQHRRGAAAGPVVRRDPVGDAVTAADRVHAAIHAFDVQEVAHLLADRSTGELRFLKAQVDAESPLPLERWLLRVRVYRQYAPAAEEGLRRLRPALSLVEVLELYDEGWREVETAQLDVIEAASRAERRAADGTDRLAAIYEAMDPSEELRARLLIAPGRPMEAMEVLLDRAAGWVWDDEDAVFDGILRLSPEDRVRLWDEHEDDLESMLDSDALSLVQSMLVSEEGGVADEAAVVDARLRLATEGRLDDAEGIQRSIDYLQGLQRERRELRGRLADSERPEELRAADEHRLAQLSGLEGLTATSGDTVHSDSYLGRLREATDDPDEFGRWALSLGADSVAVARERILMAGTDDRAMERALLDVHAEPVLPGEEEESALARQGRQVSADNALRRDVLDDPQVEVALERLSHDWTSGRMRRDAVVRLGQATPFIIERAEFRHAASDFDDARLFLSARRLHRIPGAVREIRDGVAATWGGFNAYPQLSESRRAIVDTIFDTGELPLADILAYTGDRDTVETILRTLPEAQRSRLRLGYLLARRADGDERALDGLSEREIAAARDAFSVFQGQVEGSQTTMGLFTDDAGVAGAYEAALGPEATAEELATGEGRFRAAELMYRQQQARLELDRGGSAAFTETDETMVAAAREFAARWLVLERRGTLTTLELAMLAALHERFTTRGGEFEAASETASEVASIVASTVAATAVILATGGAATPGVLAMAAAAGGTTRVLTREMMGSDYYDATDDAARDAVLGSVDGALAVVGASLAARGAQLVGLGGRSLLQGSVRVGAQAAEEAGESLGRRVATGVVEGVLDGAFSGSISEGLGTLTDERAWRRGVWDGLVATGRSALLGGLTGLATGGVLGGVLPVAGAGVRRGWRALAGESVEDAATRLGSDASETLRRAREAAQAGDIEGAYAHFRRLESGLNGAQARALWRELSATGPEDALFATGVRIGGARHTLSLVESGGRFRFTICTWCTDAEEVLDAMIRTARAEGDGALGDLRALRSRLGAGGADADPGLMRDLSAALGRHGDLVPDGMLSVSGPVSRQLVVARVMHALPGAGRDDLLRIARIVRELDSWGYRLDDAGIQRWASMDPGDAVDRLNRLDRTGVRSGDGATVGDMAPDRPTTDQEFLDEGLRILGPDDTWGLQNHVTGSRAEAAAHRAVELHGWEILADIRNPMDQGIDIVARSPDGQRLAFFEVKGTRTTRGPRLSPRQETIGFVDTVLGEAVDPNAATRGLDSAWTAVHGDVVDHAEWIRAQIDSGVAVEGNVINVYLSYRDALVEVVPWAGASSALPLSQ